MLITEFEVEEESLPKLDALLEDDILVLGLPDWTPPTPPVGDWPELQKTATQQPLVEVNWINNMWQISFMKRTGNNNMSKDPSKPPCSLTYLYKLDVG